MRRSLAQAYEIPEPEVDPKKNLRSPKSARTLKSEKSGTRAFAMKAVSQMPMTQRWPCPMTGGSVFDTGPPMEMTLVRAVQKKLACLIRFGSLPEAARAELHAITDAYRMKQECNKLVDQASCYARPF
jgi:hypothetical protein